jgi:peptidyl-prolyl cis-trans isomerase C
MKARFLFLLLGLTAAIVVIASALAQPVPIGPATTKSPASAVKKAPPVAEPSNEQTVRTERSSQDQARRAQTVASFEGGKITVGDLEDEIEQQSPMMRERYFEPEQRKLLLEKMIRLEMLAREAEKRGYGQSPDVTAAVKQNSVQTMIREKFDAQISLDSIPLEEVKKYYDEHVSEFVRPEMRRGNRIVVATREEALQLIKQLQTGDLKEFRQIARERSLDQSTKMRAGDLGFFDKQGKSGSSEANRPPVEESVVKAVFSLAKEGDLSTKPIKIQSGFSVVKYTGRRPGVSRDLKDADTTIRKRLWRTKREEALKAFIARLRGRATPEIHPELVEAIQLESGPPGADLMPGFPGTHRPGPPPGPANQGQRKH